MKSPTDCTSLLYTTVILLQYFSLDKESKKYTIVPKNLDYISLMGQSSQLSFFDAKAINTAYCSSK